MKTLPTPETLATEFTAILRDWLTREELVEIDSLNRAEPNGSVCHSHDFCDPNQAMLDALARFGVVDYRAADKKLNVLIDKAWSFAKNRGFSTVKPTR